MQSQLAQTEAIVPALEIALRQANNKLCALMGLPPHDLRPELGAGPIPGAPPEVVVGIPGELAAKLGLEVKRRTGEITGAKHPIIGGLADEWISYILPIEQYNLGKYEASMSFYGPTLSDVIVKGALAGVENLEKLRSAAQARN